jgi:nitrite reductase/ring-hydroxylating ferredoxin subunit
MKDDLLAKLSSVDPVTDERLRAESRSLGDLPGRIAAGESPVEGRIRRLPRVPRRAVAMGLAAALLAIGVAVPLALLSPLGGDGVSYGFVGDGWFRAGALEELQANEVTYLPEVKIFVVAQPNAQPYALDAVSPHMPGSRELLLYCTTSRWFFSPAHGEMFDLGGGWVNVGPAPSGMMGVPVRVQDDFVDVETNRRLPGEPIGTEGSAGGPDVPLCGANGYREVRPGVVEPIPATGLAPIDVSTPQSGDVVTSPVTIAGTADVFEGTVSYQIKDMNGELLAHGFTTATCSIGCRGDYSVEVPFEVEQEQAGTILIFERSAEDDSKINVVEIPVTLQPGNLEPIEVSAPQSGDIVSSTVTIAGTADVTEGNVRIRILDGEGDMLADTFTTATCSLGCRGDFSDDVKFHVDHVQDGTIQVFEESMEDGSVTKLVEIPVTLAPKPSNSAITVTTPSPGDEVSSSFTIAGTADVFEATVSIRILDEKGNVLVDTTTMATCGTGCTGDFSATVSYSVDRKQIGTIQVFEVSTKDSSAVNVVEIPVTLLP